MTAPTTACCRRWRKPASPAPCSTRRARARAACSTISASTACARSSMRAGRIICMTGLAGSLEAPDIPRLLLLAPDVLGFRRALCREGRGGPLDAEAVALIRGLIPLDPRSAILGDPQAAKVDYRLLAARGYSGRSARRRRRPTASSCAISSCRSASAPMRASATSRRPCASTSRSTCCGPATRSRICATCSPMTSSPTASA